MSDKPVKILLCVTHFHPSMGGVQRYCEELFSRLVVSGKYEVHVVTLDNANLRQEVYRGIHVYRLRSYLSVGEVFKLPHLGDWRKFVREIAVPGEFRIISTQTRFFITSWMGARLAKRLHIPHLHTEHGGGFVWHQSGVVRLGARVFDETLGRAVLRSATAITAVSTQVQQFVWRLSRRKAVVVYNAIDVHFWDPAKCKPLPAEWSAWQGKRATFLFAGRLIESKGWRVLLEAVATLPAEQRKSLALFMAGGGPEADEVEKVVAENDLADCVLYVGRQTPEQVRDLLAVATYVNPSYSASEGLQTTLLEAVALGSYVITTDVSGASEVITAASGVVIPRQDVPRLSEAIAAQLVHPTRGNGRPEVVKTFSWGRTVEAYEKVLSSLLNSA